MKKTLLALCTTIGLTLGGTVLADQVKGLNVVVTSPDRQTQMMAMVLSMQTLSKHNKAVNMVLCGAAGDLSLKETKTEVVKPVGLSPSQLLGKIIQLGAKVEVCPLYLPNAGKTEEALLEGVSVAKPPVVAGRLLDDNYHTLSY
ncbi:MAG: hypothetical protein CSB47_09040 [Proteobacteria bacterium]|nr:MAG: hypothetical protein CSB47_09040 [Pseudomonadota bacterium]